MNLVKLSDYDIKSINYYWRRRANFNITESELATVGVTSDDALVDVSLIPKLQQANELLQPMGYELIVKDAYRSKELYDLVRRKRYENDGQEVTDQTLSKTRMPHATGLAVDVNLVDLATGAEIETWDKADWPDGIFVGFYKDKTDATSQRYQQLQDLLIDVMQKAGFKSGPKNEFHHFELPQNEL
ncbi:MAG: M15 family metallopeptidase [Candidatus Saccharibacteria bacterium]